MHDGHDHGHPHEHSHVHAGEEHSHPHTHPDGADHSGANAHDHSHGEGGCAGCSGCAGLDKTAALLKYMLEHNTSHTAELSLMADKLRKEGKEEAAEQIIKAVSEYEKGNIRLSVALSII